MFTHEPKEEAVEFIGHHKDLLEVVLAEINKVDFSETAAHLLGNLMTGIDKARGAKKGGEEKWTRQEVLQLLGILIPSKK